MLMVMIVSGIHFIQIGLTRVAKDLDDPITLKQEINMLRQQLYELLLTHPIDSKVVADLSVKIDKLIYQYMKKENSQMK